MDDSFGPSGRRLVSTSTDETARVWDVEQQRLVATLVVAEDGGWLAFTPDHFWARPDLALSGGAQNPEYSRVEGRGNFRISRAE